MPPGSSATPDSPGSRSSPVRLARRARRAIFPQPVRRVGHAERGASATLRRRLARTPTRPSSCHAAGRARGRAGWSEYRTTTASPSAMGCAARLRGLQTMAGFLRAPADSAVGSPGGGARRRRAGDGTDHGGRRRDAAVRAAMACSRRPASTSRRIPGPRADEAVDAPAFDRPLRGQAGRRRAPHRARRGAGRRRRRPTSGRAVATCATIAAAATACPTVVVQPMVAGHGEAFIGLRATPSSARWSPSGSAASSSRC